MFPSLQRVPFKLLHYCLIFKVQPLFPFSLFRSVRASLYIISTSAQFVNTFFELFYNFLNFSLCILTKPADRGFYAGKVKHFRQKKLRSEISFVRFARPADSIHRIIFLHFRVSATFQGLHHEFFSPKAIIGADVVPIITLYIIL